jgi:predicted Zn-dependent protease
MRRPQLIIAAVLVVVALASYFGTRSENPITGETQHVGGITPDQEVALGLQAAPQMAEQFGGLEPDERLRALVQEVGQQLVQRSVAASTPYKYDFHLLADTQTINAFALPGGQIFITRALFDQMENEAQLAGVLGHEAGHVVARHSAEHMAKQQLTGLLAGAAGVAASDPNDPYQGQRTAQMAAFVGQMVTMKYGREDELESDRLGVRLMAEAGYDPRALIGVMEILKRAGGGGRTPEFFSTHPDPGNRDATIRAEIEKHFPNGIPSELTVGRVFRQAAA